MKNYILFVAKLLTLVAVIFVVIPILLVSTIGAIVATQSGKVATDKNIVAIIKLDGVIEDSKEAISALYKQAQDDKVQGIVLRINSPGGAVGPSQDIYHAVMKLKEKKPIVASMGSIAASGGFYAALGASKIYCQPGTLTGSIGVIMQIPNVKKISDTIGLQMVTVKSGALKDVGNMFRDMTPEEQEYLQSAVNQVQADFVQAVVNGRKITKEKVLPFADGRMIVGSQAKALGLVDEFGDVYDAAKAVLELKGIKLADNELPKLVYVEDKFENLKHIFDSLLGIPPILKQGIEFRAN
jgi:protease IV